MGPIHCQSSSRSQHRPANGVSQSGDLTSRHAAAHRSSESAFRERDDSRQRRSAPDQNNATAQPIRESATIQLIPHQSKDLIHPLLDDVGEQLPCDVTP